MKFHLRHWLEKPFGGGWEAPFSRLTSSRVHKITHFLMYASFASLSRSNKTIWFVRPVPVLGTILDYSKLDSEW